MFFSIIFIAIGVALLLNAVGLLSGSFWGVFWGVVFLVIGIRMLLKDKYPICEFGSWQERFQGRMAGMHSGACCQDKEEKTKKQK